MPLSAAEILAKLSRGETPRILLLAGSDESSKRRVVKALLDATPDAVLPGTVERFEAGTATSRILDACRSLSLLGGSRVVIARQPAALDPGADEQAKEQLLAYCEAPLAHAVLLLLVDKLDGRTVLAKRLEKLRAVVACEPPGEREMPGWIASWAQHSSVKLSSAACQLLADALGTDTVAAESELRKLALLYPQGTVIGPKEVEAALGPTRAVGAFALEDALLAGNSKAALEALHRHLEGGDFGTPLAVLGRLASIVRRLALAGEVLSRGGGESQIQSALGVHPFVAQKYSRAARQLGPRSERALAACVRADLSLKSGGDAPQALSTVVTALADNRSTRGKGTRP